MATRKRASTLSIWMNGERVAAWRNASGDRQELVYAPSWLTSPQARPLSLSLPFTPGNAPHRGPQVRAFFDNLLPDSQGIRERLAAKHGTVSTEAFDLLREIGRDCVGAVQLLPEDETPKDVFSISGEPLSDADVERILDGVARTPAFGQHLPDDDLRISIAGAQEKTALLWHDGGWQRPLDATPSTHIFKLPLGRIGNTGLDMTSSVENEWLCSEILAAYELPVARTRIARFGAQKALVVERFDRRLAADRRWWIRIPQEDCCQALAVPPWRKYESEGGPGMASLFGLLENSSERDRDLQNFFRTQVLFWMLAAPDGHAKNFSLFIEAGGTYRMTPLYDVLSAWPVTGNGAGRMAYRKLKLAMAVRATNAHYLMYTIQRRHWDEMAQRSGLGAYAEAIMAQLIERTPAAIARVESAIPPGFPQLIANSILKGLAESAQRLEQMPAATSRRSILPQGK
jgi:serine/threonine-protein kinase HipA